MKKNILFMLLSIFLLLPAKMSAKDTSVQKKSISICFNFARKFGLASNQFAVWVEDEKGTLVKNLFVTDFTAGKGWHKRAESLPSWRKAVKDMQTDRISSATPKSGNVRLEWDIRDKDGKVLEKGIYKIFIEANIKWEDRVLFVCEIKIDEDVKIGEISQRISAKNQDKQNVITEVAIE